MLLRIGKFLNLSNVRSSTTCSIHNLFCYFTGGKLPMTWYPQSYLSNLPMTNMAMRSTSSYPGRTYRFYAGPVVYQFGHGLSYTNFIHTIVKAPTIVSIPLSGHRKTHSASTLSGKAIRVTHAKCQKLSLVIHVDVANKGDRDGSHTVLVFSTPPAGGSTWVPRKQLVAFEKLHLAAGAQQRVQVHVHVCKYLSVVDKSGVRRIPLGEHEIHIGDVKHTISLQAATLGVIKT